METSFLSSDARVGIRTLQNFSSLLGKTSERLATGLKINRASDSPTAFFTARSLNNRANDLSRVIDGIGTIQRQPIPGCGRSKVSRAWRRRSSTRAAVLFRKQPEHAAKGAEFDALRTQIDQLAEDSSFLGVNLLGGYTPAVQFNDGGSSSPTLPGTASDTSSFGIAPAANGFQTNADIAAARADLGGALDSIRSASSRFSSSLAVIYTRREFKGDLRNILQASADGLLPADLNKEAANLLATQTRQSVAAASYAFTQRSASNILNLFA